MKVFQTAHTFAPFTDYLEDKYQVSTRSYSFSEFQNIVLEEGFNAVHHLSPVLDETDTNGFYTLWNYAPMQLQWAKENGWKETDLKAIQRAQIEAFQPDVFYTLSPIQYTADEIKALPKNTIKLSWFASPEINNIDFSVYHSRLTNLPSDVGMHQGFRSDFFQLSDAPVFSKYNSDAGRPIDVLFFGQYLKNHFDKRNGYIDELIRLQEKHEFNMVLALMTQYEYEYRLPFKLPMALHEKFKVLKFPPKKVAAHAHKPLFGTDMLRYIGQSKIVFNCHVDIANDYRVNMRIFEALGCGAHMLSDAGQYPKGLEAGKHFTVYQDVKELEAQLLRLLKNEEERKAIAKAGTQAVRTLYSKENQWQEFQKIVAQF